jgi:predicted component of type VI protein secretion system
MLAQLVALNDGSSILLDKPILLLGRHPECDIQIDSRKVSRRHCCIAIVSDCLIVRDLGSTNGIRINGVRITEGRLRAGDELTIGNYRYQVHLGVPEPPNRIAVRAAPPAAVPPAALDDEMLEACEEPVPLAEPVNPPPGPAKPVLEKPLADDHSDPIPSPLPPKPAASIIVPEQLDLAPASDAVPPIPPSHHPPA